MSSKHSKWEIITIMVSLISLTLSIITGIDSRVDRKETARSQSYSAKINQLKEIEQSAEEFRALGMLYLFDVACPAESFSVSDAEGKALRHADYHRLNASLNASLDTLSVNYSPFICNLANNFRNYLENHPWEQQIQKAEFVDQVKNSAQYETVTQMVCRAIIIDEFDYHRSQLVYAMKHELDVSNSIINKTFEQPLTCDAQSDLAEVKVGAAVTFTSTAKGGTGWYQYNWSIDENLQSKYQSVTCKFATPGIKIANVRVYAVADRQASIPLSDYQFGGSAFAQVKIKVIE